MGAPDDQPDGTVGDHSAELLLALRREDSRVFLGSDCLERAEFTVSPMSLTDAEADYAVERVLDRLEQ